MERPIRSDHVLLLAEVLTYEDETPPSIVVLLISLGRGKLDVVDLPRSSRLQVIQGKRQVPVAASRPSQSSEGNEIVITYKFSIETCLCHCRLYVDCLKMWKGVSIKLWGSPGGLSRLFYTSQIVMQLTSRCMLVPGIRRSGISTQAKRNNLACLSTSRSFGSKSSCPSKG
jgi:hypothetical protein